MNNCAEGISLFLKFIQFGRVHSKFFGHLFSFVPWYGVERSAICLSLLKLEGGSRGSVSRTFEFAVASAYDSGTAAFFYCFLATNGSCSAEKSVYQKTSKVKVNEPKKELVIFSNVKAELNTGN